jgi:cell division topological specificity factor
MHFFKMKPFVKSASIAKERLKLVLLHDRTNVPFEFIEMVKSEIIKAVSVYMVVDEDRVQLDINNKTCLMTAVVPLKSIKKSPKL